MNKYETELAASESAARLAVYSAESAAGSAYWSEAGSDIEYQINLTLEQL